MPADTLRPRQVQALNDLRGAYNSGFQAPILVAPTGFGKTATAAEIVRQAVAKGRRVWFLAHLKEILSDTSQRLSTAGIEHGYIQAGMPADHSLPVQIVAVQTAARRSELPQPDLIIIDECHLAVADTYRKVIKAAGSPRLLGLTGTPQRLDGRGLGEVFDQLVLTCTTAELIDENLLAPVRLYVPPGVDLSGLRRKCGDFDQSQAGEIMGRAAVVGDALSHWKKLCAGRRGVAFCSTVANAKAVAEQWNAAGYRAMAVHGSSDDSERREAIVGLRAGRLDLVACAQLWIAGVDVPQIDAVIWLRPTQSLTAWLQGNGRGLRIAEGKRDLLILDHVGNTGRLGHPLDVYCWSLHGKAKRKSDAPPVRVCTNCYAANPGGSAVCLDCGHEFEAPTAREIAQVAGELTEALPFGLRVGDAVEFDGQRWYVGTKPLHGVVALGETKSAAMAMSRGKGSLFTSRWVTAPISQLRKPRHPAAGARTLDDLLTVERERGYRPGWARHVWASRNRRSQCAS